MAGVLSVRDDSIDIRRNLTRLRSLFKRAVEVNPDDAKSLYELAEIYELQKKLWLAREARKRASQVYHDDIKVKVYPNMLGRYKSLFKPE